MDKANELPNVNDAFFLVIKFSNVEGETQQVKPLIFSWRATKQLSFIVNVENRPFCAFSCVLILADPLSLFVHNH